MNNPLTEIMGKTGGFHWRDGWWFCRQENGVVLVVKQEQLEGALGAVAPVMRIPPGEWASIVGAVAANGRDHQGATENHRIAERLHNGGWPAVHYPADSRGGVEPGEPSPIRALYRIAQGVEDPAGAAREALIALGESVP